MGSEHGVKFDRRPPRLSLQDLAAGRSRAADDPWTTTVGCRACPWSYSLTSLRFDPTRLVAAAAEAHLAGVHGVLGAVVIPDA